MKVNRLGLIGCGLMGGSFALALKQAGLVNRVVGYSPSDSTRAKALTLGVIDEMAPSIPQAVQGADVVLLAVPVAATETSLVALAPALDDQALLMDVGSTKHDVVQAAQRSLGHKLPCFVPAHPIAGSERAGVEAAHAQLYQGQPLILTPTEQTAAPQLAQAKSLWQALGCQVSSMTPQAHDATFAAVSHLPHLLAFAFIQGLSGQPQGADFMSLAGPGFRDFSRIAASDPVVWRDIFAANATDVLQQLGHFRRALDAFENTLQAIAKHPTQTPNSPNADLLQHLNTLEQQIAQASAVRSQWKAS